MTLYHKTFEATFVNGTFAHLAKVAGELAEKAGIPVERVEIGALAWPRRYDDGAEGEIELRATRPLTDEELVALHEQDYERALEAVRAAQFSPEEIAYFMGREEAPAEPNRLPPLVPPAIEVTKP